jgi:hypothetical protein
MTVTTDAGASPAWMEVSSRDGVVTVIVARPEGSPHGAENIAIDAIPVTTAPNLNASTVSIGQQTVASRLGFTTLETFGATRLPVRWTIESAPGGKISGTQKRGDGTEAKIAGERSPALKAKMPSAWTTPRAPAAGDNFEDFRLHVEVNCPKDSSGGILLRGRYKIALGYRAAAAANKTEQMGAVAGFIAPLVDLPETPDTWETFDVTLVGRTISITRDGALIVDRKEIPGITAGAIDSHEGLPGPILLLGGDANPIRFRNATVSEPAHR